MNSAQPVIIVPAPPRRTLVPRSPGYRPEVWQLMAVTMVAILTGLADAVSTFIALTGAHGEEANPVTVALMDTFGMTGGLAVSFTGYVLWCALLLHVATWAPWRAIRVAGAWSLALCIAGKVLVSVSNTVIILAG